MTILSVLTTGGAVGAGVLGLLGGFSLGAPEWLLLVPVLLVLVARAATRRWWSWLRVSTAAVFLLVLADPRGTRGGGGLDLWVLADHSVSVGGKAAERTREALAILERTRRADDRVRVVDFATEASLRAPGATSVSELRTGETRTGEALRFALAQRDPQRAARLLVLTDGYATEPLGEAAGAVLRAGVPLDYRLDLPPPGTDTRVVALEAPMRVQPGEAFLVELRVQGPAGVTVPWALTRAGRPAGSGKVTCDAEGVGRVRLTDRLTAGGAVHYTARIEPEGDAIAENNTGEAWVEVVAGPRALLVSAYPDDPLAGLLRAQGLAVELVAEPGRLSAASLTGVRLVVLHNVVASRVAGDFLRALDFFIREQGAGLVMVGGAASFGSGGYFASPLDALLPVSMELRKEHRKLATAMAIVMDRSGSMAASAGDGRTKMDLANTGAARAIELLGDFDAAAVEVIDSSSHTVFDLAEVGGNRERMLQAVRRQVSAGGGIYVNVGLRAGWAQLQKATTGQRHLILFADAADAEEPGNYQELLAEMRAGGATVSVIGMGTEADSDAALLKDIAALGGGRIFFNAEAAELPALFAQETVSVARSAFIQEDTPAAGTAGWAEIAARAPAWPATVEAYNLAYLRPGATAAWVTEDEYRAPLVSAWTRGAGRVAAVTFPLAGPFSERMRSWPDYANFTGTLTRWLVGEDVPPGLGLRTSVVGARLELDLYYDESWRERIARTAPAIVLAGMRGGRGETAATGGQKLLWEKLAPGHFRAGARLTAGQWVRGAVQVGTVAVPFGPVGQGGTPEWSFDRERREELRRLAERSGGRERLDLAGVWGEPRVRVERSLRPVLMVLLLGLILAQAAQMRWGWRW